MTTPGIRAQKPVEQRLAASRQALKKSMPTGRDRLRALIITESEPFHVARALDGLLRSCPRWLSVAGIARLPFGPVGTPATRLRRLARIYGRSDTMRVTMRALLAAMCPGRSLRVVARRAGIAHHRISDLRGGKAARLVTAVDPDVVVTFGLNRIVPDTLLRNERPVWVNVHLGLLPDHRGPAPVFWALHDGDARLGVSVHMIESEVDAGAVLARRDIEVTDRNLYRTVGALRMSSGEAVVEALSLLRRGDAPRYPPPAPGPLRRSPSRADVERFRDRGNRLL